jgi:hypothetical protein
MEDPPTRFNLGKPDQAESPSQATIPGFQERGLLACDTSFTLIDGGGILKEYDSSKISCIPASTFAISPLA